MSIQPLTTTATSTTSSIKNGTNIIEPISPSLSSPPSSFVSLSSSPNMIITSIYAGLYVLSGCSQPLLMTICKYAGLADTSAQIYMMFYYLGPALVIFPLLIQTTKQQQQQYKTSSSQQQQQQQSHWPSIKTTMKACGIAIWDISAATMNYTGAGFAGPTIFAIVYSSVTVWTAVWSFIFLKRQMNCYQWIAVLVVFGGLTLTTTDSLEMNMDGGDSSENHDDVIKGLFLVLFGSMMHALAYVMNESIMTVGNEKLTIQQNCAFQGIVAFGCLLCWQLIYTIPRFNEKITIPMEEADTTIIIALTVLFAFAIANLIHALTYFHTLRHYPGGATSAGVMKGLQAVLVFVFTHYAYCGRLGGEKMCFTRGKLLSLITVSGGVIGYGIATQERSRSGRTADYQPINDVDMNIVTEQSSAVEIEPLND